MKIKEIMARAIISGQWKEGHNGTEPPQDRIDRIRSLGDDSSYNVTAEWCVKELIAALEQAGYQIDPVEPTNDMLIDGYNAQCKASVNGYDKWQQCGKIYQAMTQRARDET